MCTRYSTRGNIKGAVLILSTTVFGGQSWFLFCQKHNSNVLVYRLTKWEILENIFWKSSSWEMTHAQTYLLSGQFWQVEFSSDT